MAKWRISKVTRIQSTLNFPKSKRFLPPDTHPYVSVGKKMFAFRKIWRALYSCYLRFEIRPFVILPTKLTLSEKHKIVFLLKTA